MSQDKPADTPVNEARQWGTSVISHYYRAYRLRELLRVLRVPFLGDSLVEEHQEVVSDARHQHQA